MKCQGQLQKCTVFFTLWMAYLGCHLLRAPYGVIKSDIEKSLNVSDYLLGYIDFSFSLSYSLCSIVLGFISDVFESRLILGCGLMGAGISSSVMGKIENMSEMYILLFLNGAFQAICWPSISNILTSWIPPKNRSSTMALFITCVLVGTACGSLLTVYLLSKGSWRSVFGIPSLFVVIIGILVLILVRMNATEAEIVNENIAEENKFIRGQESETRLFVKVRNTLVTPTLVEISLALLFAKGLKNGLKFWLPLYLHKILQFTTIESGLIPLSLEFGGLIGSVLIINVFERVLKCCDLLMCTICSFLATIAFLLLLFTYSFGSIYLHVILFLGGATCNVSEIIIGGSYATKLAEKRNETSTIVGIVNGIGSLGNVIEGPIVSAISYYLGLTYFIHFITISSLLTFLCLLKSYYIYRRITLSESPS